MLRALFLGWLLFAGGSWAQSKGPGGPPYPGGAQITFQWNYSCPTGRACSFSCPGVGGANSVTNLNIYLGTAPIGDQSTPALFYDFATREIPRANGFSVGAGVNTLS